MTWRLLPSGDRGLLVEVDGVDVALAVAEGLRSLGPVEDVVPADGTVLVRFTAGVDLAREVPEVERLVASALAPGGAAPGPTVGAELVVPVVYDGPDLALVAAASGLSVPELVAAHTGTPWRAAFSGFAPGFVYLVGGDPRLVASRRAEPRPSVPAGSVALAGPYSAIYPRESPGGWQLVGRTGLALWDVEADPPATVQPGMLVRFVDAGAGS